MEYSYPEEVNVVIIGAGISGLVLARQLAEAAISVAVLEQRYSVPRNGGFAGLVGGDDLRALGIDRIERVPVREIVTVDANDGWRSESRPYPDEAVFAVTHDDLLRALRQGFRESNVPVVPDRTVTELLWAKGAVSGVKVGPGHEEVRSRLVVLADESDPRLAETLGLRPDWPPTRLMHVGKERFAGAPDEIARRFGESSGGARSYYLQWKSAWGDPVEGYIVPVGDRVTVGVNYLLEHEMASAHHVLEVLAELKAFPAIRTLLSELAASDAVTEVVPVGWGAEPQRLATDGILVVSDVVGATNPLNRDGLSGNLEVCTAAARVIREALAERDVSAPGLASYGAFLRGHVYHSSKGGLRRHSSLDGGDAGHPLMRTLGSVTTPRKSATLPGGNRPLARAFDRLRRAGVRRSNS